MSEQPSAETERRPTEPEFERMKKAVADALLEVDVEVDELDDQSIHTAAWSGVNLANNGISIKDDCPYLYDE